MLRATTSPFRRAVSQLRHEQLRTLAGRTLASFGTPAPLHTQPYTHARPRPHLLADPASPVQRRFVSQDSRAKIQAAVTAHPVVVFMKGTPAVPQCGFSRAAVQVLDIQGVPPEKLKTYDVLADPELRSEIKAFSEWPTIPQVYVGGEFVGGCDILLSMHQSGELETLLDKHGVIPKIESGESSSS